MNMNPVGWFEIYVQDMPRAKAFYEAVLGYTLQKLNTSEAAAEHPDMEMWAFPAEMNNPGAAGSLVLGQPIVVENRPGAAGSLVRMAGCPSGGGGTLVYFACEDCAVQAARVAPNGGHIHRDKVSIGPFGFIALATDTEGNMFGLHSMK